MQSQKDPDKLIEELKSHWGNWEENELYYIEDLAPKLFKDPEKGDEVEERIFNELKVIYQNKTGDDIPNIFRERLVVLSRKIEKEKRVILHREDEERKVEKKKRIDRCMEELGNHWKETIGKGCYDDVQLSTLTLGETIEKKASEIVNSLIERFINKPELIDPIEIKIRTSLKELFDENEWASLHNIISCKKNIKEIKTLLCLRNIFTSSFLDSDDIFSREYSDVLSRADFENEKIKYVQNWFYEKGENIDIDQAQAIASCGVNIQLIARAGSGKTTTLVNRVIFYQEHCGIPSNQQLLLAFNKKAAQEMEERLKKGLGDVVPHVMTFHALAYAIVHPEEKLLYDDQDANIYEKSGTLQIVINDHVRDSVFRGVIRDFMLEHFRADWEKIVSGSFDLVQEDFLKYRRSLANVSLRGDYMKSFGEKLIADYFFENNISYSYEKNHWWNGINYRPDFTIVTSNNCGIIIEYFGLVGDTKYDSQIEEKREYWKNEKGWKLIEVFPKDVAVGRESFFKYFCELLGKNNISSQPLSEDEIWERIEKRSIGEFTKTITNFVSRCRKRSLSPEGVREMIGAAKELSLVEVKFLNIANTIFEAYLNRLESTGEEDFDGLLQRSTRLIRNGKTAFDRKNSRGNLQDIRYVLIDEYQDFSDLFMELIDAIRLNNKEIVYFCVGDDWQAINGFAGSNLEFYNNFEKYFAPFEKLYITTNYRSDLSIVSAGNALMKNESGEFATACKTARAGVVAVGDLDDFNIVSEQEQFPGDKATPAVLRIISKLLSTHTNIVMLSRMHTLPWYINNDNNSSRRRSKIDNFLEYIRSYFSDEDSGRIMISTTHKFKGLQSDAVIIMDAVDRRYPLIHPNWLYMRVFGDTLESIVSEERRLFYVALTRAVKSVIILTESSTRSPFLEDVISRENIDNLNWQEYPSLIYESSLLTVELKNPTWKRKGGTFAIKEQLKADNFHWDSKIKLWKKNVKEEDFSIETLQDEVWSKSAHEIFVYIKNSSNEYIEKYFIEKGEWTDRNDSDVCE